MKKFFGYISKDKITSLFGYELGLRDQKCKPVMMGEDDKKYYVIYLGDNKPKGLGRNKEIFQGELYVLPNQIRPHF
jgi:hypothetical protein